MRYQHCFSALLHKSVDWYDKPSHSKVTCFTYCCLIRFIVDTLLVMDYVGADVMPLYSLRASLHHDYQRMRPWLKDCLVTGWEPFFKQLLSWFDGSACSNHQNTHLMINPDQRNRIGASILLENSSGHYGMRAGHPARSALLILKPIYPTAYIDSSQSAFCKSK